MCLFLMCASWVFSTPPPLRKKVTLEFIAALEQQEEQMRLQLCMHPVARLFQSRWCMIEKQWSWYVPSPPEHRYRDVEVFV